MNSLTELQKDWQALGSEDPLWAVLNDPATKGGKWSPVDFLAAGDKEIATVFDWLAGC